MKIVIELEADSDMKIWNVLMQSQVVAKKYDVKLTYKEITNE